MANNTRPHPCVRMTVPVPVEAYEAFRKLSEAINARSLGSCIGEWLLDQAPAAESLASQIRHLRAESTFTVQEVLSLTETVQEATRTVVERAKQGRPVAAEGSPVSGESRPSAARKKVLTPPSSNTGGKVGGTRKKTRGDRR